MMCNVYGSDRFFVWIEYETLHPRGRRVKKQVLYISSRWKGTMHRKGRKLFSKLVVMREPLGQMLLADIENYSESR